MKRYLLPLVMLVSLTGFGCEGQSTKTTATVTLAAACSTATAALRTARTLDTQGKLSAAQIATVTKSGNIINGICAQPTAPVDIQGAINVVLAEATVIKF